MLLSIWGGGKSLTENDSSKKKYMGSFSPEKIPYEVAKCHMGLVWDGTSTQTCAGGLGEYLQYNNSHKCALYLASGLPVFVWSRAGLAEFVCENQCGFVINSLEEITSILENLTPEKYEQLRGNVRQISENIRRGYYLERALNEVRK